ncbi:MAG: ROK family protein [Bacteroidales bacterium]|nr:ROK family protein [Bacteroidales bacterium]
MYNQDPRTVITLDAGGTHFRFSAMRGCEAVTETFELPTHPNDLAQLLEDLRNGFQHIIDQLPDKPVAISFAFPGPADYPNGVFPDRLTNFPCFEGGVALSAYLENQFGLPVFINNDADLFTYGEALAGALPMLNEKIRSAGGVKQYHNLIGFILGTGFGIGITSHNQMFMGDNCCSEIYCTPSKWGQELIAEEGISLRAVLRYYRELAHDEKANGYTDSYDIYRIADGTLDGDKEAAKKAFARFGEAAGYAIAQAACMLDGIIVLGGGVSKAARFYMPALLQEVRATMHTLGGNKLPRVPSFIYNLEDPTEFEQFVKGQTKEIEVFGTDKRVRIDTQKRLGITLSQLGTSRATAIGAYCFALHALDANC